MKKQNSRKALSRRAFVKQGSLGIVGVMATSFLNDTNALVSVSINSAAPLRAAVFGDSVMWGQGLRRQDVFANNAIIEIGKMANKSTKKTIFLAHSGAPIRATEEERKKFVETFSHLFKSKAARARFITDNNQQVAKSIYGEVPCTFPTIAYQVEDVNAADANNIQLVLLNGGPNDLDFPTFLNPKKYRDNFVDHYSPLIQEYSYNRVRSLIRVARERFPAATIIFTGYFTPFYPGKSNGEMKKLLYHLAGAEGYEVWLNEKIKIQNADQYIKEAQHRALFGHTMGLFWTSKAIIEAISTSSLRGPGIMFVHPQFKPENTAFEPKSFFHNQYKLKDIKDPAKEDRESGTFSVRQFTKMHRLRAGLMSTTHPINFRALAEEILEDIAGPSSFVKALKEFISSPGNLSYKKNLRKELEHDINRIINARRASFLHPNKDGAKRYTDEIVQRYRDRFYDVVLQRDFSLFGNLNGTEQQKMSYVLKRYGFNQYVNQPTVFPHLMKIDSIAVAIFTAGDTEKRMFDNIYLRLDNNHVWQLNFPFSYGNLVMVSPSLSPAILKEQFQPNQRDFFTIDGMGMHLSEITSLSIERKKGTDKYDSRIGKGPLRIRRIVLYLNGVEVFVQDIVQSLFRDKRLSFPYPHK